MSDSHPNPNQYWFHHRTMAYACLAFIFLSLTAALAGVIREPMIPLVEGLCWILGFIVAAYYTNNAVESFARMKK